MQPTPTDAVGNATIAEHAEHVQGWVGGMVDYCARLLAAYGFRVLGAIVVLIVAYIVAGWTRRAILAALTRANLDVTISKFASNAARYAVAILGLMSCAPIMGINITAFAAVRDALAHDQIGGPTRVTTVRLLGPAESRPPAT
jgi:small-conductance mechanosensitive channel